MDSLLFLTNFDSSVLLILQLSILFSSVCVVIVRNPIYSILFLIVVFALTSIFFIMLNSEFLAMVLVIVYLGAVCVLFLFVVMMLNIKIIELKRQINFIPFFFVVLSFFVIIFSEKIWNFGFILEAFSNLDLNFNGGKIFFIENLHVEKNSQRFFFTNKFNDFLWSVDIMKSLGLTLYTFYILQFISASLVLLVAMIGAIFLTLEVTSKGKKQFPFFQLSRSRSLFLVKK